MKHDEFDELAATRSRAGTHLRARSTMGTILPFVLAIILGPLLALGAVTLASHRGGDNPLTEMTATQSTTTSEPTESKTVTLSTDDPTEAPSSEAPTSEDPSPTEEPTTEAPALPEGVKADASVLILNGTGNPGAENAEKDKLVGMTSVETGTYTNARPVETTLYFRTPDDYATAQYIAQELVIDHWLESPGATADYDVVIVLR